MDSDSKRSRAALSWATQVVLGLLAVPVLIRVAQTWWVLARPLPLLVVCTALGVAVWRWRSTSTALVWGPPLYAWGWLLAGLALVFVGSRSGAWRIAGYGLPLLLVGGVGFTRGEGAIRRLWPAAILALLAVPHPNAPTYHVIAASKGLVGSASAALLTLCGIPTALDGWILDVAGQQVRMVDACSGARTQAGLLAVVALLVCLRPATRASRLAMLAACVPAALIASILRVVCVGACYAQPNGTGWAEFVHALLKVGVIVPGVLLVLGAGWLVRTFQREARQAAEPSPQQPQVQGPRSLRQQSLALLLLAAALVVIHLPRQAPSGELPALPSHLDGLEGWQAPDERNLQESLQGDRVQFHQYGDSQRQRSTAFLVHFQRLDAPHDLFTHAPEVCHKVFGWTVLREADVELGPHRVRRLEIASGNARRVVHFAYVDDQGHANPSLLRSWLSTIWAGVLGRSTERTLLLLSSGDQTRLHAGVERREGRRMEKLLAAVH